MAVKHFSVKSFKQRSFKRNLLREAFSNNNIIKIIMYNNNSLSIQLIFYPFNSFCILGNIEPLHSKYPLSQLPFISDFQYLESFLRSLQHSRLTPLKIRSVSRTTLSRTFTILNYFIGLFSFFGVVFHPVNSELDKWFQ